MRGALFLDRDGTIIVDRVYLADPAGVELIPGTADALRMARSLGYRLYLFSNQSGVGRGFHTLEDARRVNARMEQLLGLPAPVFDGVCLAPEAPGQPVVYRKPSPRFLLETMAAEKLDPGRCWMVGDSASDIGAGLAAGIRAAAVRTGKVSPEEIPAVREGKVPVFADLAAFVSSLS